MRQLQCLHCPGQEAWARKCGWLCGFFRIVQQQLSLLYPSNVSAHPRLASSSAYTNYILIINLSLTISERRKQKLRKVTSLSKATQWEQEKTWTETRFPESQLPTILMPSNHPRMQIAYHLSQNDTSPQTPHTFLSYIFESSFCKNGSLTSDWVCFLGLVVSPTWTSFSFPLRIPPSALFGTNKSPLTYLWTGNGWRKRNAI